LICFSTRAVRAGDLSLNLQKSYSLYVAPIPNGVRDGLKEDTLDGPGTAGGKRLPLGGKQLPFLATQVVPPPSLGLIDHPRLLAMASQLSAKRLAVIKAPPGFGKTSLAANWELRIADRREGEAQAASRGSQGQPVGVLMGTADELAAVRDGNPFSERAPKIHRHDLDERPPVRQHPARRFRPQQRARTEAGDMPSGVAKAQSR